MLFGQYNLEQVVPPAVLGSQMKHLIRPMLPTLVSKPFSQTGWINEEKYDGFRALAYLSGDNIKLYSRNLKNITADYLEIAQALRELSGGDFVLDGEIVAFDQKGVSRFQLLQRRGLDVKVRPIFTLFDCLEIDGDEILKKPLIERREALETIVPVRHPLLMRSRLLSSNGRTAYEEAKRRGWEGIVAKKDDSPYEPGKRTRTWLKVKCRRESEFVIGGYTLPAGHRTHFGALLVGLYDGGKLRYTGKVGTGYSEEALTGLAMKMKPLARSKSPFEPTPREGDATWVQPILIAQIAFAEWTKDGKLRQPAFLGLRYDKKPAECQWRERDR
jgi:bifunctional non-homologous end joining protein LigD